MTSQQKNFRDFCELIHEITRGFFAAFSLPHTLAEPERVQEDFRGSFCRERVWCIDKKYVMSPCPVLYVCVKSIYEPGKRHWLKMKKDYLAGGAMADTADLIVLGAYYGTGNKGTQHGVCTASFPYFTPLLCT